MRSTLRSAALLPLAACVLDPGPGPNLGECADYPDESYTFGEIGIGTCLAGPAAMAFHTVDGRTLLAVTNADPFRTFSSGSLLEIDADALAAARGVVNVADLPAWSLPMEAFVGGLSMVQDGRLAVVASRLSAGSYLRRVPDRVWFVDVSDPERPRYLEQRFASVGADPFATAYDDDQELLFVVNATDASVSVLDTSVVPPRLLDPAPASIVTEPVFDRVPGSIGVADLRGQPLPDSDLRATQAWTATWIEGTFRLWVPTGTGLARFSSGGQAYVPSGLGVELDPSDTSAVEVLEDPWAALAGGALAMFFSDAERVWVASTGSTLNAWTVDPAPVLTGDEAWNARVSGPSVLAIGGVPTMYYDGRPAPGAPAALGVATSSDGVRFSPVGEGPLVAPPPGFDSLEQPSALVDPHTGLVRVWASARAGDRWSIVHLDSTTGRSFGEPQVVLEIDDGSAAAPVVTWFGGRYEMWLTVSDDDGWAHATAWSWDGYTWSDPEIVVPSDRDLSEPPPRGAVQPDPTLAWRVTGSNDGVQRNLAIAGVTWLSAGQDFSLEVASGHVLGTDALPDAEGGLQPGSIVEVDGVTTLYATAFDDDLVPRLVAFQRVADAWFPVAGDLVPSGPGVLSPTVYRGGDGTWHLLYAAVTGEVSVMRRAVSDDGLTFRVVDRAVLPDRAPWEAAQQLPHAVVEEGDALILYYSGFDGSRWRIGTARSTDGGATWRPLPGDDAPWVLDVGEPGAFDDSGVRDPTVVRDGDRLLMWYAGLDGATWRIGQAERVGGTWVRSIRPGAAAPQPVLGTVAGSFAAGGVISPVAEPTGDRWTLWHGGTDGMAWRIGSARAWPDEVYPEHRFPTAGDTFRFATLRGEPGRSAIRLGQVVDGLALPGAPGTGGIFREGPTSAVLDPDQGFLYVGSEDFPGLVVVDVRDDSDEDFADLNYLDIEAVLRFDTTTDLLGVSAMARAPDGRLYLSTREPDAVLVVDPSFIEDDDAKQLIQRVPLGVLPMHDLTDDDGDETFAALGAAGLAVVPSQNLLIVTHFRDNSVSVFDLGLGPYGEEIRHLEDVGENPHTVVVSPDETWAVVATYLGSLASGAEGATLAVLDLDPTSPTYLDFRARIVNQ